VHLRGAARAVAREAAGTWRYRSQFSNHELIDAEGLRRWQAEKLAAVLHHASKNVPFYKGLPVPETSEHPAVMRALSRWPVIDKQRVRDAGNAMCARNVLLRFPSFSSGTTGSPMKTWRTPASIAYEQALIERQLRWAGWRRGQRRVWLRGDRVIPLDRRDPPFWQRNPGESMLMCSSFHLAEDTAPHYIKAIEAYDPFIIQAYPSSISYLARWLNDHGCRYWADSLRAIVTSSERMTPPMREACELAFGVPVFDWYGQSERVAAIGTCERGQYHVMEDSGFVELEQREADEWTVIGTSLANRAMPLIRYDTGDSVQMLPRDEPCACGLPFRRVATVQGRETETIVTSNGRHIVMPDFVFDDLPMLKEAQFVQTGPDAIEIRVVLSGRANLSQVDIVRRRALERFGPGVQVSLKQVDSIPRTANGKFQLVVNQWQRK
jgi:phenylacetate-CoA ligase